MRLKLRQTFPTGQARSRRDLTRGFQLPSPSPENLSQICWNLIGDELLNLPPPQYRAASSLPTSNQPNVSTAPCFASLIISIKISTCKSCFSRADSTFALLFAPLSRHRRKFSSKTIQEQSTIHFSEFNLDVRQSRSKAARPLIVRGSRVCIKTPLRPSPNFDKPSRLYRLYHNI